MVQLRRGAIELLFALRIGYTLDIAQWIMSHRRQMLFQRTPILESRFAFLTLRSMIAFLLFLFFLLGNSWYKCVIGAKKLMVPLNYWYKPLASTTEPFVLRNGWYKCVTGTKKQLVLRDYWYPKITGTNKMLVP
ncbi:hypothetical protein BKA65DRAFT_487977 [Rhexocercosporidium sp. MPI-PUGE-AT-0058]|nr:hypothetical protein BKA65DRAFT_487977 [Rhexocercosporidium sp. MPI-PUGE-AT-0058]